jgi:hypothetical protein
VWRRSFGDEGGKVRLEMKNALLWVGGFCAAAAGFLVWESKRVRPVQELAHKLEHACGDGENAA